MDIKEYLTKKTNLKRIKYMGKTLDSLDTIELKFDDGNDSEKEEILKLLSLSPIPENPSIDFLEDFFAPFPTVIFTNVVNPSVYCYVIVDESDAVYWLGVELFSRVRLLLGRRCGLTNQIGADNLQVWNERGTGQITYEIGRSWSVDENWRRLLEMAEVPNDLKGTEYHYLVIEYLERIRMLFVNLRK